MRRKSDYRNVFWYGRTGRWIVKVHVRNHPSGLETFNVGYYRDEDHAARVADLAEQAVRGYCLVPNLPDRPLEGVDRSIVLDTLQQQGAISTARMQELLSGV